MNIEIKSRVTDGVLFSVETESLKLAVEAATKSGANLHGAVNVPYVTIIGSRHSVVLQHDGILRIGCHSKPLTWWQEHYKDVGEKEGYTESEISEYGGYINRLADFMKSDKEKK